MIAFIIRRLLGALLVMFAITVLTFLIFFATPSNDPAARIAGRNADPRRRSSRCGTTSASTGRCPCSTRS